MTDYTKLTDFASKDTLPTGNAAKIVKGTEIDDEFEAIETAVATKADLNSPTLIGTPVAPTASLGTDSTQIATTAFVNNAFAGMIVLWSGSTATIPTGWVLCDGTNSTPDLRNRFVVGAGDTYAVDATGGSADLIVPAHTHEITDPGHVHAEAGDGGTAYVGNTAGQAGAQGGSAPNVARALATATTGIEIDETGESATNANLPPYYALAYIMKT